MVEVGLTPANCRASSIGSTTAVRRRGNQACAVLWPATVQSAPERTTQNPNFDQRDGTVPAARVPASRPARRAANAASGHQALSRNSLTSPEQPAEASTKIFSRNPDPAGAVRCSIGACPALQLGSVAKVAQRPKFPAGQLTPQLAAAAAFSNAGGEPAACGLARTPGAAV